jgi:phosphotransferase system  glucose/maltose/N-acetylglucosamine-specific IIC component
MQFIKKTSSSRNILGLLIKLALVFLVFFVIVFLLNKINFPAPSKEIEKIIPNENFKVVK